MTDKLSTLISLKMAEAQRSSKREAKLRVKIQILRYFDAKLRFALLASLRFSFFKRN
jgi:hypothetical protein